MKKFKKKKIKVLIYLLSGGLIFVSLLLLSSQNRYTLILYILFCLLLFIYGIYESNTLRVRELIIESKKIPKDFEELKIIFFSDIQMDYFFSKSRKRIKKLVDFINNENPDIALFGGDYINKARGTETVFSELKELKTKAGFYTVYGNHDYYDYKRVNQNIEKLGIIELKNKNIRLSCNDKSIVLAGVDDYLKGKPDIKKTLSGIDNEFTVLLCHNPDYFEVMEDRYKQKIDIVLSGHTHGGQINLFGFAPFIPSKYGSKYRYGLKEVNGKKIYISSGLGGVVFPLRFLSKPEIVRVRLRAQRGGEFS